MGETVPSDNSLRHLIPQKLSHTSQLTNSWPLVFGITAAHYLVGAGIWTMWVGDSALPEDDLGVDPGPPRLLPE